MYLEYIVGLAVMYRKVYFNDQYENPENVANQKQFIEITLTINCLHITGYKFQ